VATQNILREEAHLTDVIDPLGGSYYVETLTDEMEAEILRSMRIVEDAGGMYAAAGAGIVQKLIGESARRFQEQVESGTQTVVGVNASGQVREFQLRLRLKFRLRTPQGKELITETELLQQRDIIRRQVIGKLDHKNINLEVDFMKGKLASTENLAIGIWNELFSPVAQLGATLHSIKVFETENNFVEYLGEL